MIYVGYGILVMFFMMCLYTISCIIYEKFRIQYVDIKTGVVYYQCHKFTNDDGCYFVLQSSKDGHCTTLLEDVLKERFKKK